MAADNTLKQRGSPLLLTANRHLQAGRLEEAEGIYNEILQKEPENDNVLQHLGFLEYQRNNPLRSVELMLKAITINPLNPDHYINLGAVYKHFGRFNDAIECYQTALQLKPDAAEAFNNLGNVYKDQGMMDKAFECFEKAMEINPKFSRAKHNLGLLYLGKEELDKAIEYFNSVIEIEPDFADAYNNLANAYNKKNENEKAIENFKKAIQVNPGYIQAHFNLGNNLLAKGQVKDAIQCYQNTLKLNPNFYDALFNLGRVLLRTRNLEEALTLLLRAQKVKPHYPQTYLQIGLVLHELNRIDESLEYYNKAITLKPDFAEAYYNLGNALYAKFRHQDAIAAYEKALELKPDFCEAHNNYGNVLTESGQIDKGEAELHKALELNSEYPAAHNNLGNIYKQKGDRKKALDCYQKALDIDPNYPEAHRHLALSNKYSTKDMSHAEQIKKALGKEGIKDQERMHLHFALGKIYDDCEMFEEAFNNYKIGNDLRHKQLGFDLERHTKMIDGLIDIYSNEFFNKRRHFGVKTELPVFVVGMPRSGTTLVEQIISSHPDAHAAGELSAIHQLEYSIPRHFQSTKPYPEIAKVLEEQSTQSIANEYLRHLRTHSETASRITDKMPDNFLSVGFIRLLFPQAHIIHCRRFPLDSSLSIYFQFFVQANGYAYDLETLGKYYLEYLRIMEHWRSINAIKMYEVQYEDLVADQEKISREIIEYIGLEWDEQCLEFHKNKRPVRTASSDQVRRPMYSSSIERWKNYENYIQPLINVINSAPANQEQQKAS